MNGFDYNPLADAVTVSYVCSECNNTNVECIMVPSPDLSAETARESISTDNVEIQCGHCGKEYRVELATSYNAGLGVMPDVKNIIEVEEDFPNNEDNEY